MHHYAANAAGRTARKIRRAILFLSLFTLHSLPVAASAGNAAVESLLALKAAASLDKVAILDAVRVGQRITAVGERSLVFVSNDEGKTWSARPTAAEKSLTAVIAASDGVLLASGHSGMVLRSADGGEHWQQVPLPESQKEALLGMLLLADGRIIAYGGYASLLESADGGRTWAQRSILDAEIDKHFYGMAVDNQSLVLVGEAGLIAISSDQGRSWKIVPSPYHGSLFGVSTMANGTFVAYGMRGKILVSGDRGLTWRELPSATKSPFFSGTLLKEGALLLGGKDGVLARITADGQSVETRYTPDHRTISRIVETQGGEWLLFGEAGTRRVQWKNLKK